MEKCIKPTDERIKKENFKVSESNMSQTIKIINEGLVKGETSFNNVLDKLPCSKSELSIIAMKYENEGWNTKVVDDNYDTYTIIF